MAANKTQQSKHRNKMPSAMRTLRAMMMMTRRRRRREGTRRWGWAVRVRRRRRSSRRVRRGDRSGNWRICIWGSDSDTAWVIYMKGANAMEWRTVVALSERGR
jgi:hypothetical protein